MLVAKARLSILLLLRLIRDEKWQSVRWFRDETQVNEIAAAPSALAKRRERAIGAAMFNHDIHVIGGGLAGSEAAWQLAEAGLKVRLSEMRGTGERTPAHHTDDLAELVCSNSFRSDDAESNAVGLLHAEMRALGSVIMAAADAHRVPAGSALAVDREGFSASVTARVAGHPNVELVRERVDALPGSGPTIVATGPLTALKLAEVDRARRPGPTPSPFSTRSRRSSTMTVSTWMSPGWRRAGTKAARTTSTALSTAISITPLSRACSAARRPNSGVGEEHALFRRLHADRSDGRAWA
jgi:hypothetical protein